MNFDEEIVKIKEEAQRIREEKADEAAMKKKENIENMKKTKENEDATNSLFASLHLMFLKTDANLKNGKKRIMNIPGFTIEMQGKPNTPFMITGTIWPEIVQIHVTSVRHDVSPNNLHNEKFDADVISLRIREAFLQWYKSVLV